MPPVIATDLTVTAAARPTVVELRRSPPRPALLRRQLRIPAFVAILWIVLAALLALAWPITKDAYVIDFVLFATVAALAECWFVNTSREAGMSLSFTVHFAALILFGPAFAIVIVLVGIAIGDGIVKRRPLVRTLFNMAQMSISVAIAGFLFVGLTGLGGQSGLSLTGDAGALALAALIYMILNDTLVSAVISLSGGSFVREWIGSFRDLMLPYISMGPLGALVAYTYTVTPWSILYYVPLTLVIYNGFKLFVTLQRETDHALVALADSIDKRDRYTYQHSQRVAMLAGKIAEAMGVKAPDVDVIVAAARVHDLGKIALDNRLLLKPSRLTAEERTLIEVHPVEGGDLAGQFKMFRRGLSYIRHHHERWDGAGYPDGLAGADIPLGARIITVADCFDAMTSDRPYRGALPAAVAIAELHRCAGTQFDRDIVAAFTALAERDKTIAAQATHARDEYRCSSF